MSIAARPSRLDPAPGSRLGGERSIGTSQPPTDLLPEGGSLAPAPASTPERVLARDALRLLRFVAFEDQSPEIETVRRQLDPIRSRRSLAASYRREAVNRGSPLDADTQPPGVVRLAYARRWLELGPDRR
jgi:hypothetical protein